jgi:hypothetical protein
LEEGFLGPDGTLGLVSPAHADAAAKPLDTEAWLGSPGFVQRIRARLGTRATLFAIVAFSAGARLAIALMTAAPWISPDEWKSAELARSLIQSGQLRVWDTDWPALTSGPLYAAVISPAYLLGTENAYLVIKAINAGLMSLAAIPAYYLARRIVAREAALFAAFLALLVPSMVYTTKVMTENLAYPLFLAAVLAIVRVLEQPSLARQAVVLALMPVIFLTRAELIVMLPIYVASVGLAILLDMRAEAGRTGAPSLVRRLTAYRATWFALLGSLGLFVAALLLAGRSPAELLGSYDSLPTRIRLTAAPKWLLYQVAEIDLASGVIPFAAFGVITVLVLRRELVDRSVRLFVATSLAAFVGFMTLAGVYETVDRPFPHLFERYVFYVMPLFFVAFVLWIERGSPRPRGWTPVIAAIAGLLPAVIPYATVLNGREWGVSSSTPSLVPWALLHVILDTEWILVATVLALCVGFALLFLRIPNGKASVLKMTLVASLWLVTLVVGAANTAVANIAAGVADPQRDWIDRAIGPDAYVGALWARVETRGENAPYSILEAQFFNKSVRAVYELGDPVRPGLPGRPVVERAGALVLADGSTAGDDLGLRFLVADPALRVGGTEIARSAKSHLVLYRISGPVRIARISIAGRESLKGPPR